MNGREAEHAVGVAVAKWHNRWGRGVAGDKPPDIGRGEVCTALQRTRLSRQRRGGCTFITKSAVAGVRKVNYWRRHNLIHTSRMQHCM